MDGSGFLRAAVPLIGSDTPATCVLPILVFDAVAGAKLAPSRQSGRAASAFAIGHSLTSSP